MTMPSQIFRSVLAILVALVFSGTAMAGDLAEIKEKGVLRHLGIRYANFVTGTGDGFDVELVQGFAKYIGVKYQLVYSDFYNVIRDLLGREVIRKDAAVTLSGSFPIRGDLIAAGFTVLPWRSAVLLYSEATFPSQVLLVAPSDSSLQPIKGSNDLARDIAQTKALIGKKSLLVMEKTCLDPANYALKGTGIDLRAYTKNTNLNEMVPALLNRESDLTLLDVPDLILDLKKWGGQIKILGPISEHQILAAAFPKDAPLLRDTFNEYLRQLKADGSYDRLVDKYYPGVRRYFPEFFGRTRGAAR
jgi:hypothetical protein